MSFEFPPAPDARTYVPQVMSADEVVRLLARIPGVWARRAGGNVSWGKLDMIPSDNGFIPNTMTKSDLDEVEARLTFYDLSTGSE